MKKNNKKNTHSHSYNSIIEWITYIGVVLFFVAFIVTSTLVNIKNSVVLQDNPKIELELLIWDSFFNVGTGLLVVFEIGVNFVAHCFGNMRKHKVKILTLSIIILILSIFDNIAIKYPFHQLWIILANLIAILVCIILIFIPTKNIETVSFCQEEKEPNIESKAYNTFKKTNNKKIIAIQLYKVETSFCTPESSGNLDSVLFEVTHVGKDFVRPNNDVNSISKMTYIVKRNIIDNFELILQLYYEFIDNGNDSTKDALLTLLDKGITLLKNHFELFNKEKREVNKEDCCCLRILIILLSFKNNLTSKTVTQNDYLGEIHLDRNELGIDEETENKLYSLYRTGILGASLLHTTMRHVFRYRKNSEKQNRIYCASQLVCKTKQQNITDAVQTMYICLFTVQDDNLTCIPGYVFESIKKIETELQGILENNVKENITNA